jgi:hypothetical protein
LQSSVRRSTYSRFLHHSPEVQLLRLLFPVIPAILPIDFILLGTNDIDIVIADTSISNNEVASNISKASNSSASATITITMYAGDGD